MKPRADGRHAKTKRVNGKKIFGYGATPELAEDDLAAKVKALTPSIEPIEEPEVLEDLGDLEPFHHFAKRVWWPTIEDQAPLTITRYRSVYRKHIKPRLKDVPISKMDFAMVQEFVYQMKAEGVPGPTIRYVIERLSTICTLAMRYKKLNENINPCVGLAGVPDKTEKRERVMPIDQALEVLAAVDGTDLSAPVLFALVLGLRRGEIAGLKWEHLDRQRGELRVAKQRQAQAGKGVVEKEVKSQSFRTHRLSRFLVSEIDRRGNLDSEFICTRLGEPWVPQTIYDDWLLIREGLGLGDWTLHDLRHGAAGLLYATGSDLLDVAAVLGQKKPDMALRYTSITKERAAESLGRLVDTIADYQNRDASGSQKSKARLGEGGPG